MSSTLSKVIVDRRRGHFTSAFYSVELYVMTNFSLCHSVLCFSFVVALYSMYSLYAIIKVVLLDEGGSHV